MNALIKFKIIMKTLTCPKKYQFAISKSRSSHRRYFVKKAVLKNFAIIQENTCVGVSY